MSPEWNLRRSMWTALVVAAVALAGCGSDESSNESAESAETTVEEGEHSDEEGEHSDEVHDDHGDDEDHDHDGEGLGAHEHGAAELSVAWTGADVAIDLVSPTINVFGFEYEPETDEDIAIEADRTEALIAPGIIAVNDEAGCRLAEPATTETEREASHAEISVSWQFTCDDPDQIREIDAAGLFTEFPGFEDVDVQWLSDSSQSSAELTPGEPAFEFDG